MPRNKHFAMFQDHTRLKHFLLEVYLKQWATILITGRLHAGVPIPKMLWFVDAFAGAGHDEKGTPGSPVIAAKIATEINKQHYTTIDNKSGMHVLAIEAHAGRCQQLKTALKPYSAAEVRHGSLENIIDKVMPFLQKYDAPALFFLDPFGVHGLDAKLLPEILRVSRTEILLLFSDEGAVRLAGKAEAKVPSRNELLAQKSDGRLSLGEQFDAQIEERDRLDVEQIIAGHASNPRAAEILDVTFGGKDWRKILESPASQRRQAFVQLYTEVLKEAGADYVLPFAVTTAEGRHKYTLMHASTHSSAFVAMKNAMHRAYKKRPSTDQTEDLFGASGVDLPSDGTDRTFSSGVDIHEMVAQVQNAFSGQLVPWTGKSAQTTVSDYALRHTPLLQHELPLLDRELVRLNYLEGKKPRTFRFP